MIERKYVLSLFDASGNWPKPWADTHEIITIDLKQVPIEYTYHTRYHVLIDVLDDGLFHFLEQMTSDGIIDVILAAPPCTDFSGSGARWWAEKDADGRTAYSISLIKLSP